MELKSWIQAARLRTLPLAFSSIIMGSVVVCIERPDRFKLPVFLLAILTTLLLQILSNFANDYGDGVKGTDALRKHGPERLVQSGKITAHQMKVAVIIMTFLSLVSGLLLLYASFSKVSLLFIFFLLLGLSSIAAAIKYTVGKTAFGYRGLGDFFVFVFFGLVGTCGFYFLQTQSISFYVIVVSIAMGCGATAVLNLNNIRDIDEDRLAGKITIPVRIGKVNAVWYQYTLVGLGSVCMLVFFFQYAIGWRMWVGLVAIQLLCLFNTIWAKVSQPQDYNLLLARMAISTFLWSILSLLVLIPK